MIRVVDADGMEELGARLAAVVRAGDVLCLTGELGAGKTTLTRGFGRALDVRGTVTSPTFVIARTHPRPNRAPLVHIDAYRLQNAAELEDLDIDWEGSIVVIEWGHGMLDGLVESWLELVIERSSHGDDEERVVTMHAVGERGRELADEIGRGDA